MDKPFAAGIIPWTRTLPRSPLKDNQILFLLGLETSNKKWSGFVGGQEPGETIPETAIREFNEETAEVFKNYLNQIYANLLITKPYIDTSSTGRNVYIYFIEFPYSYFKDANQFKLNRSLLPVKEYREKSDIKLFSADEIQTTKNIFYKIKRMILVS